MLRQIFITTRNVITTSGELRLIKNRNNTLKDMCGITTHYIVLTKKSRLTSQKTEDLGEGHTIESIMYKDKNLLSFIIAYFKFIRLAVNKATNEQYNIVCLSGFFLGPIRKLIGNIEGTKIFIDLHGTINEILEYKRFGTVFSSVIFSLLKRDLDMQLKNSNILLVVSKALAKHVDEEYKNSNIYKQIIPCSINYNQIRYEKYRCNRKKWRERYHIPEKSIVFVYSGGLSKWQQIDESIDLFYNIKKSIDHEAKMIVFTNGDYKKYLDKSDIIFDSLHSSDVDSALMMADFGFLLRECNLTNKVAFPNKYVEYVAAGLDVITNGSIEDVEFYNSKYGVGMNYSNYCNEAFIKLLNNRINSRKNKLEKVIKEKEAFLNAIDFKTTCKDYFI